jgi:hypothetical protein
VGEERRCRAKRFDTEPRNAKIRDGPGTFVREGRRELSTYESSANGGAPLVRSADAGSERAADGSRGPYRQYAIYKPLRSGKGGVLRFELNPQTPAVFVTAARQIPGEQRRFDWENKVVMKWGLSDIGEILAALERRQDGAKLFHSTDKAKTAFELKRQEDRNPPNFFASMSRRKPDANDAEWLGVAVTQGEAAVLCALLGYAALVLSSWSVPVG